MDDKWKAPLRLEEYADCLGAGDAEPAKEVAESLTEMDCPICTRVGTTLFGIAMGAEAAVNEEVESRLVELGVARADALAEDFEEAKQEVEHGPA